MKEIDDSGPEFAEANEPVGGGKQYDKLAVSLAARALLSAAVAGLLTLSVLTSQEEIRTSALYGGGPGDAAPPAVENLQPPEEPKEPEEPPTTPPPTTPPTTPPSAPPPTTPPPTTAPPTTPPPTTPPPTTPPPTTPPPYVPPYDPPADTFTEPKLVLIDDGVWGWYDEEYLQVEVGFRYRVDLGSAKWYRLYWSCKIPGWPNTFESSESIYSENSDTGSGTLICSQSHSGDDNTPPPTLPGEGTLFLKLECDTGTKTYPYPFEIPG